MSRPTAQPQTPQRPQARPAPYGRPPAHQIPRDRRPAPVRYERPQADPVSDRVQLMARAQQAQNIRYARAFQALNEELEDMKIMYARAEREKDLVQLEAEGVLFDRVEELDTVMSMDDECYARHVNTMRKRYQRAPIGRLDFSAATISRSASVPQEMTRADADRIADYALQHGLSYNEAKTKLAG